MPKEDFRFHIALRVRWAECDPQNIVYYPHYLTWLETALAEYCRRLGFRMYRLAELNQYDTVTAKIAVEYKAPARLDDVVEVYARPAQIGNTSLTFVYELFLRGRKASSPGQRWCTSATTTRPSGLGECPRRSGRHSSTSRELANRCPWTAYRCLGKRLRRGGYPASAGW